MRWFWIDRFTEFERGRRAVAIKCVATVEEQVDEYTPGFPTMPVSLMIEGMAQTAGLLVGEMGGFEERVVLAKIGKAEFRDLVRPGDTLHYEVTIVDVKNDGALTSCIARRDNEVVAEVDLMFAFLGERFASGPLFEPVDFVAMLRAFSMYDVGRDETGQPIELPEFYAEAERAAQACYELIPSSVRPG